MEVLLTYKANCRSGREPFLSLLPIGLGYINAFLRKRGHHSRIANMCSYSWHDVARLLAVERPDILGVSQFTHNRFECLRLARVAKEANPACFVVFGGPHATHRAHEILSLYPAVDAVVLGEGEQTFAELADRLASGTGLEEIQGLALRCNGSIVQTPARAPLADLDALPLPAAFFDDALNVDTHRQLEFIITSRGCPASCSFCSSPRFWGKTLRFRSPKSIVEEIRFIRDRYGLIYFSIRDDTFTSDRSRVLEFCRLLLREKLYILWNCQSRVNAVDQEMLCWMKRAGCECIQYGVESGSRKVLRSLGKGITPEQVRKAASATRRAGIHLSVYLITGVPGESENDLQETLSLLDEIKADDGQVSPLAYFPGTRFFDEDACSGAITAGMFEETRAEAVYVREDSFTEHSKKTILSRLAKIAERNHLGPREFLAHKRLLGYCHATNIMAGEMYESRAEWQKAEAEYHEITRLEPGNPWGWLMIGELYAKSGNMRDALQAFEQLVMLVPCHAPGFTRLGDIHRSVGDVASARDYYRQALKLNSFEKGAEEGLRQLEKQKRRTR